MTQEDVEARTCFLFTLDWLMAVTLRYASPVQFGLVHIAYGDKNQLGEAYGAQEAVSQLAAVTQSLKKAFRKTDLVCRNGTDFWVIVPYTPSTEKLYDKVLEILEAAEHEDLHIVDRETSIFNLTDHLADLEQQFKELSALDLLEYLKQNKGAFARHTFALPSTAAFA